MPWGRTNRFLLLAIFVVAVAAGGVFAWRLLGEPGWSGPPLEEVARTGFAVWPEDSDEEAGVACEQKADEQPWRRSAERTALRFAEVVMGHEGASIENHTNSADDAATISLSAPSVFLSNYLQLRRYDGCWYVVKGDYREGSSGPSLVFVNDGDRIRVYLESSDSGRFSSYQEIGFGPHLRVFPASEAATRRTWLLPEGLRQEGHLISLSSERGETESVFARKLPPPPHLGAGERVFPSESAFSWKSIPQGVRALACRQSSNTATSPREVINKTLEGHFAEALPPRYPSVEGTGSYDRINERILIDRKSRYNWKVKIDGLDLWFRVAKATGRCWALGLVKALNEPRPVQEAFLDDAAMTVDVRWGRATEAEVSLSYGFQTFGGSTIHGNIGSPVAFYRLPEFERDFPQVGQIFISLIRNGRYVNALARRLPPLESLS